MNESVLTIPDRHYLGTAATAPGPAGPEMLRYFSLIRKQPQQFLLQMAREYGESVQLPIPRPPTYLLTSLEAAQTVHLSRVADFDKETVQYRALSLVTGDGLLTTSGQTWREQRRALQPAFHRGLLSEVREATLTRTSELLANSTVRVTASDLDELSLLILQDVLFPGTGQADVAEVAAATLVALVAVVQAAQLPVSIPAWLPTKSNRRLQAALSVLNFRAGHLADAADSAPDGFLAALAQYTQHLPPSVRRRARRDQLVTFIVAGHETVASCLQWSLLLLAQHPRIQQELADELLNSSAHSGESLELVQGVVAESLRLYPPAWVITRRSRTTVSMSDVVVPRGSLVLTSPYVIQRDPAVWDDPEVFRPSRHRGGTRDPKTGYLPFGLGMRTCIGKDFALVVAHAALAALVRARHFHLPNVSYGENPGVTLRPDPHLDLATSVR